MGREIKFRAWDNGEMHVVSFNNLSCNNNHPSGQLVFREDMKPFGERHVTTLMQYTGLRDKNGTEIYEGDVVTDGRYSYEIRWSDHAPSFEAVLVGSSLFNWLSDDMSECEVIGNIYENADLLANTVSE